MNVVAANRRGFSKIKIKHSGVGRFDSFPFITPHVSISMFDLLARKDDEKANSPGRRDIHSFVLNNVTRSIINAPNVQLETSNALLKS